MIGRFFKELSRCQMKWNVWLAVSIDADKAEVGEPANDLDRDDPAATRRPWILQELGKGRQLKAPDVVEQFSCAVKTAQRDLAALKDEGKIEFIGTPRTGYYRLCQPANP